MQMHGEGKDSWREGLMGGKGISGKRQNWINKGIQWPDLQRSNELAASQSQLVSVIMPTSCHLQVTPDRVFFYYYYWKVPYKLQNVNLHALKYHLFGRIEP